MYLPPVYAYFRASLRLSPHDAQDLTIEFLAALDEYTRHVANRPIPQQVRFRDFLRRCARNFAASARERDAAQKRGGKFVFLSYEEHFNWLEEDHEEDLQASDADLAFDREWAITLVTEAQTQLAEDFRRAGKEHEYDALAPFLIAPPPEGTHAAIAQRLSITEAASKKKLERLRDRFGKHLRTGVARTLQDPADIDDELRHLRRVWLGAERELDGGLPRQ
jgi:RNA polymerase sigma-70 factor (ECF subfamily)